MASINEKNIAKGDKKKFQLILVGYDDSKEGNEAYLKKGINFPGLKVAGRESFAKFLDKNSSGFLPDLVLINAKGEAVEMEDAEIMAKMKELAE